VRTPRLNVDMTETCSVSDFLLGGSNKSSCRCTWVGVISTHSCMRYPRLWKHHGAMKTVSFSTKATSKKIKKQLHEALLLYLLKIPVVEDDVRHKHR
jgi:hypothetical protein